MYELLNVRNARIVESPKFEEYTDGIEYLRLNPELKFDHVITHYLSEQMIDGTKIKRPYHWQTPNPQILVIYCGNREIATLQGDEANELEDELYSLSYDDQQQLMDCYNVQ